MKKVDVIKLFGSQRAVARALGISEPAVSRWGEEVPPLRVYQLRDLLVARAGELKKESDRSAS